jgi:hypothetical protein
LLILELYPHPAERRLVKVSGNPLRTWRELDSDDPWRFYLSALSLEGDVLTHEKTFIHRETGEIDGGRREQLVLYTPEAIEALLTEVGFAELKLREGWTDVDYSGGDVLVVAATRR